MKKEIISTFHHSFAGGSKNTCRLLNYTANNGHTISAYFFEMPQYFTYAESRIKTFTFESMQLHSEVIDQKTIQNYIIINKIIEDLHNRDNYLLFAANLFPYCFNLHEVKTQLFSKYRINPKLIIHPVGSDIWQIGSQIKTQVKWLLESPHVDSIVTYSNGFINEIKEYYNIDREINILPPIVEKELFFPISISEIKERRSKLGFYEEDFIIHHHSSMRKVKCPDVIIEIVLKATQLISRRCILIMSGPIPFDEIKALNLNLIKEENNSHFIYKSICKNLLIFWTGITSKSEFLLQISNVELNASLHDSFNLSLMEAMACGIPVVTSNIVGISEHIVASNSGHCFPSIRLNFDALNDAIKSSNSKRIYFDIDYAVDTILSLEKNLELAKEMGKSGAKYVLEEFSFSKVMKEFKKHVLL